MPRYKLTIEYDGGPFVGWQRQANGRSVQAAIEDAVVRLTGEAATIRGAGRTDAGVHALAQVASASVAFAHDIDTVRRALNARLPAEVRVMAVSEADTAFHARFSARGKTYRYLIANTPVPSPLLARYAWHIAEPLDRASMEEAAAALVGTHDFAGFQGSGGSVQTTTRTMTCSAFREVDTELLGANTGPLLAYEISGDGFLRHMVRAIVGTLVEVGRGWRRPDTIARVLEHGDRRQAGATAPAHGLFLVRVDYEGPRPKARGLGQG